MKDQFNLSLKGEITITSNRFGTIYRNNNAIGENALEIITRCLSTINSDNSVSIIKATGDFGESEAIINAVFYEPSPNMIKFRAVFYEQDFSGTINTLELISEGLGLRLAFKEGLSILKNNSERVQVDWRIYIQTTT